MENDFDSINSKNSINGNKLCAVCKKNIATQRHHLSYNPEIIIEVCRPCHEKIHKHGTGTDKPRNYKHDLVCYQLKVPADLWNQFRITAMWRGQKIYQAILQAIEEYIEKYTMEVEKKRTVIEAKIIGNIEARENLLQFAIEQELRRMLKSLIEAKQRNANTAYIKELKFKIIETVKKHPIVSKDLAYEIKRVFQNLT
jgi:hypothetical protein